MIDAHWQSLADALLTLEMQLRDVGLWSTKRPEPGRLVSQSPFCVDTLEFEQWLQWVFIPRMTLFVNQRSHLPAECNILPMAEESFAELGRGRLTLLSAIAEVDRLASLLVHR